MAYITMCDAKRLQGIISFLMYSRREMYQLLNIVLKSLIRFPNFVLLKVE